jgi:hypothetical protein
MSNLTPTPLLNILSSLSNQTPSLVIIRVLGDAFAFSAATRMINLYSPGGCKYPFTLDLTIVSKLITVLFSAKSSRL